jgi:MarR family transcriptional regulator, organic hydroperoxide resistance regulator
MAEPKSHSVGETLQFMQRVWELVHALDVKSKKMARELGVTSPQRIVIRIIGQKPGQTASEIATRLGKHPSTLTGVLARLESRELIVRSSDADDRRRARFHLTVGGKKIDKVRRGTVEAATRRALARAEPAAVTHTMSVVDTLVEELARD